MKKLLDGVQLLSSPPIQQIGAHETLKVELPGGLTLTDAAFQSHILIQGNTGTGKSTCLKAIMDPVLDYAAESGDAAVIFAPKPDYLSYCREGDYLIKIDGEDPRCAWNLFDEMDISDDPIGTAREIADALFREAEKTLQPFFPHAAQDLFYHVCLFLYDCGHILNVRPTNANLVEFILTTPVASLPRLPGWPELARRHPEYFACVHDYIGSGGSDQGMGVLSELRLMIARTFVGSFAEYGDFSVQRALREPGRRIILYFDYAKASHSVLPIYKILVDIILKESMRSDRDNKVFLFLDEAHLLPKSDVLVDALSFGRDPSGCGRGGLRLFTVIQSAQLMTKNYTETEAKTLLSLYPNVISFRVTDPLSRSVIKDRYGDARYSDTITGAGGRQQIESYTEPVVADYRFSALTKPGMAIMSIPSISESPFLYNGYKEGV